MRLTRKTIAALVLLLAFVIGITSIRRTELAFVFRIEDGAQQYLLNAEFITIEGYVVSLPFRQYFAKGTVAIGDEFFQIDCLKHIRTRADEVSTYWLPFIAADRHSGGELVLVGNIMRGIANERVTGHTYDTVLDKTVSFEGYPWK